MKTQFTNVQDQLNKLAEIIDGAAWGLDKGKPRIYMSDTARDRKVFFDFPDWTETLGLGGAALKIFIDDCGQSPKWYASQKRREIETRYREALAVQAVTDCFDFELAEWIIDEVVEEIEPDFFEKVAAHLDRDEVAEAKALLETKC